MTRASWWAFLVGCALSACGGNGGGAGGGGGGGSGGGSGLSADEACTNLALAICSKTDTCTPFATTVYYGDPSTCTARAKLSCVPPLALSTTGASPDKIDACAKAVTALACTDSQSGFSIPACVFSGKLAAGTACGSNSQCAGGYCRLTSSTCGVCSTRNSAGGSCTVSDDCAIGTACLNTTTCTSQQAIGQSCTAARPCKTGLWCKTGTCAVAGKTTNTPCDSNDVDSCDFLAGFFCAQSNVCAQIQTATPGNSCGLTATMYTVCSGGGSCNAAGGTVGTCVAPAGDGQSCNPSAALNCLDPATCESGTCKLTNPASCL